MDEHVLDRAFRRKYLPVWFLVGGILLLIVAVFIWWTQVYENPYNVYWGMLDSNLSVSSDTAHLIDNSSGTKLNQYIGQQFGANTMAYGTTMLSTATSTVKNESVGTLTTDYIRYTSIRTSQKSTSGKPFDFSKALNKWADTSAPNMAASSSSSTPFFAQTVLGLGGGNLLPIANLSLAQRQFLIGQLHQNNIFDTTFNNVQKSTVNGQSVYVYNVTVNPVAYVTFEKQFASDLGLKTLDSIDPNNYAGQQALQVQVSVNIRTHHLAEISYGGTSHKEDYMSFGVPLNVKVPVATMSSQALQSLISQSQ
jgi:hypothetical protein